MKSVETQPGKCNTATCAGVLMSSVKTARVGGSANGSGDQSLSAPTEGHSALAVDDLTFQAVGRHGMAELRAPEARRELGLTGSERPLYPLTAGRTQTALCAGVLTFDRWLGDNRGV